jgi:hypothetical protein
VEAGAADLLLLDHRHVQAGGGPVEGGGIAAGAPADHHDVELFGDGTPPGCVGAKSSLLIATHKRFGLRYEATSTWTAKATRMAIPTTIAAMISFRVLTEYSA